MSRIATLHEERSAITDAADFGRVAVMLGGSSPEREVSLDTGAAVLKALQSRGVDAHAWDPAGKSLGQFAAAGFDRTWIALHGTGGEDGALQGALQWLDMPYTGSGVMASSLAMDKIRSKHLFEACGIPTPEYAVIRHDADAVLAAEELGFPMILKPAGQGSRTQGSCRSGAARTRVWRRCARRALHCR
jgi:D-alanine-D-alanine ligase